MTFIISPQKYIFLIVKATQELAGSVSESLSLSVIHFNNIIITSFQPSLDTSVYINPLWISIKTLKNQYFAIIGHSGLVDF